MLCMGFNVNRWHVASSANKPYVLDIVSYLNERQLNAVVEIGCGFCDILSHLKASRRIGYDANRNVVRAARVYTSLKCARVDIRPLNFVTDSIPSIQADAWIIVNWIHELSESTLRPRLREVFERLDPGAMIIMDIVEGPSYRYHHEISRLFRGLPYEAEVISRDPGDCRTVWRVAKTVL